MSKQLLVAADMCSGRLQQRSKYVLAAFRHQGADWDQRSAPEGRRPAPAGQAVYPTRSRLVGRLHNMELGFGFILGPVASITRG